MKKQELYDKWVDKVCQFMEEKGREINKCASVMQSRPVLDKQPLVVFLGYNAHEGWGFNGVDRERFYLGNKYFYDNRDDNPKWKVWNRPAGMFKYVEYLKPVTDGNFVFMNMIYFGSKEISGIQNKSIKDQSIELTKEVIHDIFQPKCVVCFSIPEVFDALNGKYKFNHIESLYPVNPKLSFTSTIPIKKGYWNNIPVYGIPHPSGRVSNNDLGAICSYLKEEMQQLDI